MTAAVLKNVVKRGDKLFEVATFSVPSNAESQAVLVGAIELIPGRGRTRVYAFVNDRRDEPGKTFISLTSRQVNDATGEIGYATVAIGNVVNSRGDGGEVYFDTVIFNAVDASGKGIPGAQPVSAYVTRDCDPTLHAKLGFAQPRIPRPSKAVDAAADSGADGVDEDVVDPEERAAMVAAAASSINV
jgi:hypothetical protein